MAAYAGPGGGSIRLGAIPSAMASFVPRVLSQCRAERPRVTMRVEEGWSGDLIRRTSRGDLDLAVVSAAAVGAADDSVALRPEPFVALLPASHALAGREDLRLSDLADEPWIAAPVAGARSEVDAACDRAGIRPRITATAAWGGAEQLIAAGLGVAIAPASIATVIRQDGGVAVRDLADRPVRHLALVRAPRDRRPQLERDLEEALVAAAGGPA
jgi:LysR family transcriptional regulator, carnitine catabolism transcriptional activator